MPRKRKKRDSVEADNRVENNHGLTNNNSLKINMDVEDTVGFHNSLLTRPLARPETLYQQVTDTPISNINNTLYEGNQSQTRSVKRRE
jgi:hypothetical protein